VLSATPRCPPGASLILDSTPFTLEGQGDTTKCLVSGGKSHGLENPMVYGWFIAGNLDSNG